MADARKALSVRRRKVFYISGFDPKGPAYYHALYDTESVKQAALSGMHIEVGPARRDGRLATRWLIKCIADDQVTETDYEMLRWDDIMRTRMTRSGWRFYWNVARTYGLYIRTGALWRILKASYPAFLAGLYPVAFIVGFGVLSLALAIAGFLVSQNLLADAGLAYPYATPISVILSVSAAVVVFGLSHRLEDRVPFYWPLHIYAFAADHMSGRIPEMDQRIDQFAERIQTYVSDCEDDEVLISSHSNGTVIAVAAAAEALRRDPNLARRTPVVSFLTLGQSIPLCSFLPQSHNLRADLVEIASENGMDWVDITAPRDGACFVLTDPLKASRITPPRTAQAKPKMLSVPISDLFTAETFRLALRRRWLRIHFQYLMAYEKPTVYDYFAISAGPRTLAERFAPMTGKDGYRKFQLFGPV